MRVFGYLPNPFRIEEVGVRLWNVSRFHEICVVNSAPDPLTDRKEKNLVLIHVSPPEMAVSPERRIFHIWMYQPWYKRHKGARRSHPRRRSLSHSARIYEEAARTLFSLDPVLYLPCSPNGVRYLDPKPLTERVQEWLICSSRARSKCR